MRTMAINACAYVVAVVPLSELTRCPGAAHCTTNVNPWSVTVCSMVGGTRIAPRSMERDPDVPSGFVYWTSIPQSETYNSKTFLSLESCCRDCALATEN